MMNYKCTNCELNFEIINWLDRICPCCGYKANVNYLSAPPTEPGWYWWRENKNHKAKPVEITYEVWDTSVNGEDNWGSGLYANTEDGLTDIDFIGGEWSERIEPPE